MEARPQDAFVGNKAASLHTHYLGLNPVRKVSNRACRAACIQEQKAFKQHIFSCFRKWKRGSGLKKNVLIRLPVALTGAIQS